MAGQQPQNMVEEYEYYYDQCEKANKVPLSYEAWLKQQRGGIDIVTDI